MTSAAAAAAVDDDGGGGGSGWRQCQVNAGWRTETDQRRCRRR